MAQSMMAPGNNRTGVLLANGVHVLLMMAVPFALVIAGAAGVVWFLRCLT